MYENITEDLIKEINTLKSNPKNMDYLKELLKEAIEVSAKREIEIQALMKGSKAVLSEKGFAESARAIFDHCKNLIGATSGYVALLSETGEENEVLFLEAGGLPCNVSPELPMPIRGLRAEAYQQNKAVYHNDFMNSEWVDFMPKGHVILRNVMFAPLVLEGKTMGIIGLANKASDFNDNDAKMATGFGELAAIALQNSRHLDDRILAEKELNQYIVKLKKTDGILKKNEKRYKKAQSMGQVGNWEYDLIAEMFWGSDEAKRLYGFKPERNDFTIDEIENCIPDRKRVHQALVDLIEKGRPYDIEFEIRPITGPEKRIIKSKAEIVKDESGMPIKVAGVIQDITIKKLAEKELRKSEEKYRFLFENIMSGFALHEVVLNNDGEPVDYLFLEVNFAFEQLTGLKRNDILGKKATEVLPGIENDPAGWINIFGKVALTGKEIRFDNYSEPLKKWFSVLAFCPQKGQFATIFEDITVRKIADELQRESEEKYRRLFNSIRDYILVADTDRNIIACNQALVDGFGYTEEEILEKKTVYLYDSIEEYQEMGEMLKEHIDDTNFTYTINYKKKSGDIFPGETNVYYLKNDQEENIGFIGMIRDISYRKMIEESLQNSNNQLKEKTAALEDMNAALRVLLNKRDKDVQEIEEKIFCNYESLILPFTDKLKNSCSNINQKILTEILEKNLKEIISPFSKKLSDPMINLTPKELQIASFIKQGSTTKEMAQAFHCSVRTIDAHRDNIRIKLKIKNKKINLRSYLMSL